MHKLPSVSRVKKVSSSRLVMPVDKTYTIRQKELAKRQAVLLLVKTILSLRFWLFYVLIKNVQIILNIDQFSQPLQKI
jgi:hypothetical protein